MWAHSKVTNGDQTQVPLGSDLEVCFIWKKRRGESIKTNKSHYSPPSSENSLVLNAQTEGPGLGLPVGPAPRHRRHLREQADAGAWVNGSWVSRAGSVAPV